MNDSNLKPGNTAVRNNQADWDVDTITEQILTELNGAVTRSTIQEVLAEIVPAYKDARIRTFVPIFIRRDAVTQLRAMQAPIASPVNDKVDSSTESRASFDSSSIRNAYDEQGNLLAPV